MVKYRRLFFAFVIIAIVLVSFMVFRWFYFSSLPRYPSYKPFVGPVRSDGVVLGLNISYAERLAIGYVVKYLGLNRSQVRVVDVSVGHTSIEIKDAVIIIEFNITKNGISKHGGFIYLDATGRLHGYLISYWIGEAYINCSELGLNDKSAHNFTLEFMRELGYPIDGNNLDVEVDYDNYRRGTRILFNLTVYGYPVAKLGGFYHKLDFLGGLLNVRICNGKRIFLTLIIDSYEAIRAYELGLFVHVSNPPIGRGDAFRRALDALRGKGGISEYDYKYLGLFWVFLPDPDHKGRYLPVPHLMYVYRFNIVYNGKTGEYHYYALVDALTGEVVLK